MTLGEALDGVLARSREALTQGLQEYPLPADLAQRPGRVRETDVLLETHVFCGPGWERLVIARTAGPTGALSATVIGLPADGWAHEIVGVDLIAFGGKLTLAAIDLAPLVQSHFERYAKSRLVALRAALASSAIPRAVPTFTHDTFSPDAVIVAAAPGREVSVLESVADFVRTLSTQRLERAEDARAATETKRRWKAAERTNRKELAALQRLFGVDWAQRYLDEVLFPKGAVESLGAST